jgi:hypothetical protein
MCLVDDVYRRTGVAPTNSFLAKTAIGLFLGLHQCDQTFYGTKRPILYKFSQNRELISLNFGLIFFLNEPNAKNFAQNGELSPNLVALACTEASTNTCTNAVTANWREIRKKTK